MFEKFSLIFKKRKTFSQLNQRNLLKKEIERFLEKEKIKDQVEIKVKGNLIKIFCKNPAVFHFLKLKEKDFQRILKNFKSFKILILYKILT